MTSFILNTGAEIPAVALGTFGAEDQEIYNAVACALKSGYRHIDCAYFYKNEVPVAKAIRESGIPRDEIFALDISLSNLGLDYVDLFLVHWPYATKPDHTDPFSWGLGPDRDLDYIQIWSTFQDLPKSKTRAVGVSNMTSVKLEKLLAAESTRVVPAVNQVELHPLLPQDRLVKYCKSKNILCEAYCPLARGQINEDPAVQKIAKKHGSDPGQVILSWNVERGVIVLPKSATPKRIESNLKLVKLDDSDIKELTALGVTHWKRLIRPDQKVEDDIYQNDIYSQPTAV